MDDRIPVTRLAATTALLLAVAGNCGASTSAPYPNTWHEVAALGYTFEMADKARRLSPYDPMRFAMIGVRGFSLALRGEYDEAARLMALSVRQPDAHFCSGRLRFA